MLVVISDLHLTDGTCGSTASAGAFHLLSERLLDQAASASTRADDSYRPIERIDLVLLGDVLDIVNSSRWLDYDARPWDDPRSPALAEAVTSIAGDILRRNEATLGMLRSLAQGSLRLTPANQMGRRATTTDSVSVPVRIHYMVGNRDWFLHLPGQNYDRLRRQLVVHMGLANEPDAPFAHEPADSGELLQSLRRHRVLARHGDAFDPLSYDGHRDTSSLSDVIVIELINRFAAEIERNLAHELTPAALAGLAEIDGVRPLVLAPLWIEAVLIRTCSSAAVRQRVMRNWDVLAEAMLDHPFVRQCETGRSAGLIDGLSRALRFGQRRPIGWGRATNRWLREIRGADSASYGNHALAEEEFRNRRARHIVYGHTHQAEEAPLEASFADGYVLNQTYFNAGTMRRVYRRTQCGPGEREFIASDALSISTFYQGDERHGRPYETWTGTLGVNPNTAYAAMRVDAASVGQPSLTTPSSMAPPIRAPHFQTWMNAATLRTVSDI
ncbi:MAG: hypothetical protein WD669_05790 [Pirellulales bacterium]